MIALKQGSLALTSAVASTGLIYYLKVLFNDVVAKDVIASLFIQIGFITFFLILTTIDFITGLQASLHLNKAKTTPLKSSEVIKSHKLWRTFWKASGVIIVTSILSFTSIISAILKSDIAYWTITWAMICFSIMACGYEFYSIGENLGKRNENKKPSIFNFVDKILNAIQNKAIKKIDDSCT